MLTLVSVGGRNMYVRHQLTLGIIAEDGKSLPKALLQKNSLRWVAMATEML